MSAGRPEFPYQQDIIAPVRVDHLVEYGDTSPERPGVFGHWYNFIDYHFAEDDVEIRARHYLDEPGVGLLMGKLATDDFTMRVLVFLRMRFDRVQSSLGLRYEDLPAEVMAEVERLMDAHLIANAD